jgi:hypothetical protein
MVPAPQVSVEVAEIGIGALHIHTDFCRRSFENVHLRRKTKKRNSPNNTLLQTKTIPEIPPKFALSSSLARIFYYVFTPTNKEMYVENDGGMVHSRHRSPWAMELAES